MGGREEKSTVVAVASGLDGAVVIALCGLRLGVRGNSSEMVLDDSEPLGGSGGGEREGM